MKAAFDSLHDAEGQPKKRRSGEDLYLHSAGVAKMLMDEFGEKDADLLVEALYHDFGEDILWKDVEIGSEWLKSHFRSSLGKRLVLPPIARAERNRLDQLLQNHEHLAADNAHVVSALSIDKQMALAFPKRNLYLEQIQSLPTELRQRAAKIRIADKIYNLRSGEPDLTDGK